MVGLFSISFALGLVATAIIVAVGFPIGAAILLQIVLKNTYRAQITTWLMGAMVSPVMLLVGVLWGLAFVQMR
jgi:hypothetical protein